MPYYGGKTHFLPKIQGYVSAASPKTFIDVFGGRGVVLANIKLPSGTAKVYNDINEKLVNLFRVLQTKPEELKERCKYAVASKALFEQYGVMTGNKVEDAFRVWYRISFSFGAKGKTYNSSDRKYERILQMKGLDEIINEVKTWNIERLDFRELVQRYDSPTTFFYFDPPYYRRKEYEYNFTDQDFVDLAATLRQVKGTYLLTINDDPFIRELFGQHTAEEYISPAFPNWSQPRPKRKELFYTNLSKKQFSLLEFVEVPPAVVTGKPC